MKISARFFFLAGLLALVACSTTPIAEKPAAYSPTILISLDGFRADYLDRGLTPTLAALAADGVRARAMRPSFPTLTFPNHYTLVTGLYPDHNGIVANRFSDPVTKKKFVYKDAATIADPAWWNGEPLWVSVEKQGGHAATMFWPGSDVAIAGVRPEFWVPFDGKTPVDARVDKVLSWIDLPAPRRPRFITLYLDTADHVGHDHGPDSPEVNDALRQLDTAIARLVDGLKQRGVFDATNIVIVSDHGMTTTSPDRVVIVDREFEMNAVDVIASGVLGGYAAKPGHEREADASILKPHRGMTCWRKEQIPARLHYGTNPRIPPYVCVADDGWLIDTQKWLDDPNHHQSKGEHGYDNDGPKMRALFVAHGPA
ncbi:MAG TPA: nucleotide pyrophosphatase/phosphodiesterase family protein, partial [Rudaea sp.]|nr:nucleotide pyrophosphatase/phosphodiesterase family protein [Rudaea sp.]